MQTLGLFEKLFWAAGFGLNALLVIVLFWKGKWKVVPWFTGWISFATVSTIAMYFGHLYGGRHVYSVLYWSSAFIDVGLQLAVVGEISGFVFKREMGWVGSAKKKLLCSAVVVVLIAALMALNITPAADSARDALFSRASLFVTLLVTGLFTAVMAISQQVGVSWKSIVIREGLGFLALNLVSFVTDTLHAYWRMAEHFGDLERLRVTVYIATLIYWVVVFWLPEKHAGVVDAPTEAMLRDFRSKLKYESPRE